MRKTPTTAVPKSQEEWAAALADPAIQAEMNGDDLISFDPEYFGVWAKVLDQYKSGLITRREALVKIRETLDLLI